MLTDLSRELSEDLPDLGRERAADVFSLHLRLLGKIVCHALEVVGRRRGALTGADLVGSTIGLSVGAEHVAVIPLNLGELFQEVLHQHITLFPCSAVVSASAFRGIRAMTYGLAHGPASPPSQRIERPAIAYWGKDKSVLCSTTPQTMGRVLPMPRTKDFASSHCRLEECFKGGARET